MLSTAHGGPGTFYPESTCLHTVNFSAWCGADLFTLPSTFRTIETLEVRRVGLVPQPDLNSDEFNPHEAGPPSGWIEPEQVQYSKST